MPAPVAAATPAKQAEGKPGSKRKAEDAAGPSKATKVRGRPWLECKGWRDQQGGMEARCHSLHSMTTFALIDPMTRRPRWMPRRGKREAASQREWRQRVQLAGLAAAAMNQVARSLQPPTLNRKEL